MPTQDRARRGPSSALVPALVALCVTAASASEPGDAAKDALAALTECAGAIVRDDRDAAEDALGRAVSAAESAQAALDDPALSDLLGRDERRIRRRARRMVERTVGLEARLTSSDTPRSKLVRAAERASRDAGRLLRRLSKRIAEWPLVLADPVRADTVRGGRGRVRIRVIPSDGPFDIGATLRIAETVPEGAVVVLGDLRRRGPGRYRLDVGDEPGAVRLEADDGKRTASVWVVVTGPRRDLDDPLDASLRPGTPVYAETAPSFRVGEVAALAAPHVDGPAAESFSVAPALPEGLVLDPATGAIGGVPLASAAAADHTVTATNDSGSSATVLRVEVAPALPEGVDELAPGFVAEPYVEGAEVPVRMAFTPDGRLLYCELATGRVRLVRANGSLAETPFHEVDIATGGERGLLGIAVAPDFATTGHVFLFASVPAGGGHAERNQVLRVTADGDAAGDPAVIVDDLPVGAVHDGGAVAFGPDGKLYVSIGDTDTPALSQQDGAAAGRVLRYERDGTIPGDNPVEDDPEWARGLRNPFALTFHPRTGGLFATENGPTANDELLFVQPGKNFEWGPVPPDLDEFERGFTLTSWTPVIVPTGLTFVPDDALGGGLADDLFLCSYDLAEVRRIPLSGEQLTDVDDQVPFLRFADPEQIANKPLDVAAGRDGALYVSTFTAIWRIHRFGE